MHLVVVCFRYNTTVNVVIYMDERTSTHCLHGKFLQTADVTGTFSSLVNLEQIIPGESEDSSNRGKNGNYV